MSTSRSTTTEPLAEFHQRFFHGSFTSALRWHHLDDLWERIRERADQGWYLYALGSPPPDHAATAPEVIHFIEEMDALLRREHDEDFCGIVYADSLKEPTFVKIYDPNNLGVVCGYSDNPPLPGWVLSQIPPLLISSRHVAQGRQRWWQNLLSALKG